MTVPASDWGGHTRGRKISFWGALRSRATSLALRRGPLQPWSHPPRGCGTDALSAVLTPAARSVERGRRRPHSPVARSRMIPPPLLPKRAHFPQRNPPRPGAVDGFRKKKRARGNLKFELEKPGVGGTRAMRPPAPETSGTIKLNKVWRQLVDKGGILEPKCREGPNGVPRRGGS